MIRKGTKVVIKKLRTIPNFYHGKTGKVSNRYGSKNQYIAVKLDDIDWEYLAFSKELKRQK